MGVKICGSRRVKLEYDLTRETKSTLREAETSRTWSRGSHRPGEVAALIDISAEQNMPQLQRNCPDYKPIFALNQNNFVCRAIFCTICFHLEQNVWTMFSCHLTMSSPRITRKSINKLSR